MTKQEPGDYKSMVWIAAQARALSSPIRVRALRLLVDGELCLCQLAQVLDVAYSTMSRHMQLLYDAGLVHRRRQKKWGYYALADRSVRNRFLEIVRQIPESDRQLQEDREKLVSASCSTLD